MNNLGFRLASSKTSRTVSTASRFKSRWGTRNIHQRRGLLYPIEGGLGEFLPPAALKAIAVDYQEGLLQRLNEETFGTEEQGKSVTQTIINTAPHREKTLAFNYASLALNNSFFLDQLKPPPAPPAKNHQSEITTHLGEAIRSQHGSISQLKSSFSAAAMGMFTSGYVWFVTDKNGNTGVLPTFGPGTLLIRSRTYMANSKGLILGENLSQYDRGDPYVLQPGEEPDLADLDGPNGPHMYDSGRDSGNSQSNNSDVSHHSPVSQPSPPGIKPSSPTSGISGSNTTPSPTNTLHPRFLHSTSRVSFELDKMPSSIYGEDDSSNDRSHPRTKVEMLNIGEVLYPLFCISVHEHAWMSAGYGVWGKEAWLKQFWTVLDWKKISTTYHGIYADRTQF